MGFYFSNTVNEMLHLSIIKGFFRRKYKFLTFTYMVTCMGNARDLKWNGTFFFRGPS